MMYGGFAQWPKRSGCNNMVTIRRGPTVLQTELLFLQNPQTQLTGSHLKAILTEASTHNVMKILLHLDL